MEIFTAQRILAVFTINTTKCLNIRREWGKKKKLWGRSNVNFGYDPLYVSMALLAKGKL